MEISPIGGWRRRLVRQARLALIDRAGATAVEFALVSLVFLTLLLGIVETGRVLWTQNALHYAVQQAARCASINVTACGDGSVATTAQVQSFALAVSGATVPASAFDLNPGSPPAWAPSCSGGNLVTADYTMPLYIPFVSMHPEIKAAACFPKSS